MNQLFNIENKVIAVTGATGILAGGLARYLLEQGAKVAILSLFPEEVEEAVKEAKTISEHVTGFACDVTNSEQVQAAHDHVIATFGTIDVLINGAGGNMAGAIAGPDQDLFDALKLDDYAKVMDLNLKGTVIPSLIFGKTIAEKGQGSILNFSSMSSEQSITRVLGYSNAKAGVDNFTRWMATEMAQRYGSGVRVNAVAPGFFVTHQNRALLTNEDGSFTERGQKVINNTPMLRFGEADEVFGAFHYLMSDASSFVTGTVIKVDGGFSCYSGV
ncbi:SDR family oxidoreductase [Verrucomicrobiaceae bacterium N1E253]|uniref:SDR family oxidoreductase n=1 Tax=Oceaniferula marina TaxID=2748318 RepID=A0A851GRL3_9BACT|nr:SDR family oxidoreductase [Oceaniferula marina]NWK56854.1 SDR family oxidoreductase [Oceaniferula marina]